MKDREVTLKLNSRPLKLAYLVRDSEDLFNAISLYTHLWGGGANYIFPFPDNIDETERLEESLQIIDPDYILIPDNEKVLPELANKLAARQRPISYSAIQRHINYEDLYRFSTGDLNHIGSIIKAFFPDGINQSLIGVVESSSNITTALNYGLPTQTYHKELSSNYGAKTYQVPATIQEEIQLKLIFSKRTSLYDLSLYKTTRHFDIFNTDIDPETLCVFLGNQHEIDVCTAFWNTRWIHSRNNIFLDKEAFLLDINSHINLIKQGMPLIRALAIFVKSSYEEANHIYHAIKQAFSSMDRDPCVRVQYSDLKYKFFNGKLSSEVPDTFTRQIYLDNSVRFTPNPPLGHEKEILFGFDAEVTFSSGVKLSLPSTNIISELLTNEIERLRWVEEHGRAFYRQATVRASDKGITGIAKGGIECRLHIHPDDIFLSYYLKSLGFQIKPNKLTRYAQGFIKKLGDFEKARRLVEQGGLRIISILNNREAHEVGLNRKQMMSELGKVLKDNQEALSIICIGLPEMLSSELIRRGYSLACTHCDLKAWYSIDVINEFVECLGCAESFQLPIEDKDTPFAYKPNELASHFLQQGGQAVLTTVNILHQIDRSALLTFGGDLLKIPERQNFAEADLLWLSRHIFAIAECKCRFNDLDIEKIRVSLNKNIEAAVQIGAQVVFLGIYTNLEDNESLFDLIQSFSESSIEKNVALHLIINNDLYLWGKKEHKVEQISAMETKELLLEYKSFAEERRKVISDHLNFLSEGASPQPQDCVPVPNPQIAVGEKLGSYGGIVGTGETYNEEILSEWEKAFLVTQLS